MRFSKRTRSQNWLVASFIDEHTCQRTLRNRQDKTEWLAKKFMFILRHTREVKIKGLIAEGIERWSVN